MYLDETEFSFVSQNCWKIFMTCELKKFMILFVLHVPWVFYLAFVDVRSADTHLQPNLYHTLGGKTFHLFWLKVPVPQGRPAPLCSETAWPISQKNEWVDDFFFCIFVIFLLIGTFFSNLLHTFELK